jgi:hypothetical protein
LRIIWSPEVGDGSGLPVGPGDGELVTQVGTGTGYGLGLIDTCGAVSGALARPPANPPPKPKPNAVIKPVIAMIQLGPFLAHWLGGLGVPCGGVGAGGCGVGVDIERSPEKIVTGVAYWMRYFMEQRHHTWLLAAVSELLLAAMGLLRARSWRHRCVGRQGGRPGRRSATAWPGQLPSTSEFTGFGSRRRSSSWQSGGGGHAAVRSTLTVSGVVRVLGMVAPS